MGLRNLGTWCLLSGTLTVGCAENLLLNADLAGLDQAQPYRYTDVDWAVVLRGYVREGLVDYDALSENRASLDRYCALLQVTGPTTTPEQFPEWTHATAYWINSYNALVLYAVLHRYPVTTMYDLSMPRLEEVYRFTVDGQTMNLNDIEERMFQQSHGDVRALLATSRAAQGGPKLWSEPIRPETLDRQLTEIASRALDEPSLLRIDHTQRIVFVWQLINGRKAEFVAFLKKRHKSRTVYLYNVLLELASRQQRRSLQSAVGYDIRQAPFDRKLNRLESPHSVRPMVP